MRWFKAFVVWGIILSVVGGSAGYILYASLTPAQQGKVKRYLDRSRKSYNRGPGSRTLERARAHLDDLGPGNEKVFHLKSGEEISGKVNFETGEYYSVTLPTGNRTRVMKSEIQ